MALKVAVQMDHISTVKIAGDSTFAILLEAQARGHDLWHYTPETLAMLNGRVTARVQSLRVKDVVGDHFALGDEEHADLRDFDVVLLRQDPPFDLAYITTTHLLERVHPETLVVNHPGEVRNAPEKILVTEFPDLMPPTLITRDVQAIRDFRERYGDMVVKPLYGHGGHAVFRLRPQDQNFGSLIDMFAATFREPWMIQQYLPAVQEGDKRIILIDGEFAGAINRIPAADDLRSNMVQGGQAVETDPTGKDLAICKAIGPTLKKRDLLFVGIDVIDGYLTEINVTSPTGIRAVKALGGADIAALIWDSIELRRSTGGD